MIAEFLYQLTAKDAQTAPVLQRGGFRVSAAAANVTVIAVAVPIPQEQAFVITDISAFGLAGAAQTLSSLSLQVFADLALDQSIHTLIDEGTIGVVSRGFHRRAQMVMMPREVLLGIGTFSAGAAVNTMRFSVSGFYFPKGNLQFR